MNDYLDTNAIYSFIFQDAHSVAIQRWLAESSAQLFTSDWTETEFAALVNRRARAGGLTGAAAKTGIADFDDFVDKRSISLRLSPSVGSLSALLARDPDLKLSAADALHLAVCAVNDCRLVTFDVRLADAARMRGVSVAPLPRDPAPAAH